MLQDLRVLRRCLVIRLDVAIGILYRDDTVNIRILFEGLLPQKCRILQQLSLVDELDRCTLTQLLLEGQIFELEDVHGLQLLLGYLLLLLRLLHDFKAESDCLGWWLKL